VLRARGAGGILAGMLCVLGCDASLARPADRPPPGSATLADVDDPCLDGADEPEQWLPKTCPARPKTIEYVKLSDWTPPPSVRELEAAVPPRGDVR
jgi:hypothetical protein